MARRDSIRPRAGSWRAQLGAIVARLATAEAPIGLWSGDPGNRQAWIYWDNATILRQLGVLGAA